jgi:hypothetical protein
MKSIQFSKAVFAKLTDGASWKLPHPLEDGALTEKDWNVLTA